MSLEKGVAGLQVSNYVRPIEEEEEPAEETDEEFDDLNEQAIGDDDCIQEENVQDQDKELKSQLEKIFSKIFEKICTLFIECKVLKTERTIRKEQRRSYPLEQSVDQVKQNRKAFT